MNSVTKNFFIWLFKIIFILSIFISFGIIISLFFPNGFKIFSNFSQYRENAINLISDIINIFKINGIIQLILILITALFFITFWLKSKAKWYDLIFSFIRDLFVVITVTAFSFIIISNFTEIKIAYSAAGLENLKYDYLFAAGVFSFYFIIAISNFGGLFEKAKESFKEFFFAMLFTAIGMLPSFLENGFSQSEFFRYFIQLAFIYNISFILKIVIYPDLIVSINLEAKTLKKSQLKKVAFGFLATLILIPFLGFGWALIMFLLSLIPAIFTQVSYSIKTPAIFTFTFLIIPAAYLLHLVHTSFFEFLFFVIAIINSVSFYGKKVGDAKSYYAKSEKINNNFFVKILKRFPLKNKEVINNTVLIFGIFSLLFNSAFVIIFPDSNKNIIEPQKIFEIKIKDINDLFETDKKNTYCITDMKGNFNFFNIDSGITKSINTDLKYILEAKHIKNTNLIYSYSNFQFSLFSDTTQIFSLKNPDLKFKTIKHLPDTAGFVSLNQNGKITLWDNNAKIMYDTSFANIPFDIFVSKTKLKFAVCTDRNTVTIFDTNFNALKTLKHDFVVDKVFFDHKNRFIVTTSGSDAFIWRKKADNPILISNHSDDINTVLITDNGNIITASDDGTAAIFSDKGEKIAILDKHSLLGKILTLFDEATNDIKSINISPKEKNILLLSKDIPTLWTENGEFIAKLNKHKNEVKIIKYSYNGNFIVSAAKDKTIKIWSKKGKYLFDLNTNNQSVKKIQITKNYKVIVITENDIRIFDLKKYLYNNQ